MEPVKTRVPAHCARDTDTSQSIFVTDKVWIDKTMNVSNEVWTWVHQKYGMIPIIKALYSIETNNKIYLTVTNDGQLNWKNNKWEWLSMKVSAAKIWNVSNHIEIVFSIETNNCSYLYFPENIRLNQQNNKFD